MFPNMPMTAERVSIIQPIDIHNIPRDPHTFTGLLLLLCRLVVVLEIILLEVIVDPATAQSNQHHNSSLNILK